MTCLFPAEARLLLFSANLIVGSCSVYLNNTAVLARKHSSSLPELFPGAANVSLLILNQIDREPQRTLDVSECAAASAEQASDDVHPSKRTNIPLSRAGRQARLKLVPLIPWGRAWQAEGRE